MWGSFIFTVSDSILGYTKFATKNEWGFGVMSTYYSALIGLAMAGVSQVVKVESVLRRK